MLRCTKNAVVNDFGTGIGYQPVQPIQPIQAPASSFFTFQKWEDRSNHLLTLLLLDQEDNVKIPSITKVEDIQMAVCEHFFRFARKLIEQRHYLIAFLFSSFRLRLLHPSRNTKSWLHLACFTASFVAACHVHVWVLELTCASLNL